MRPMVVVLVVALAAAGQMCLGAGASAHEALHLQLHGFDIDLRDIFGTQSDRDDQDVLLHSMPVEPDQQRGTFSPGLNFGSFRAGIAHGRYAFDAKGLEATSVHGDVGHPSTTLLFTFPTH